MKLPTLIVITRTVAVSVTALVLSACGGDAAPTAASGGTATTRPAVTSAPAAAPTTAAPTAAPQPTAAPAAPRLVEIAMVDNRFEPAAVAVPVGATVRWTHRGVEDHDAVSEDFKTFESPPMKTGAVFEVTLSQPGVIRYVCTYHTGMTGTLTVGG